MAASGHQHPTPQLPEALAAPGLIIRMSVNLGEPDRILQFESFADRDASLGELNHLCDNMRKAGDRQRAIHVLPLIRRQLSDIETKHDENRVRLAELNAREKEMDAVRAEKAVELRNLLVVRVNAAEQDHRASGRRGEFKAPASVTGPIQSQLRTLEENEVRDHNEAAAQRATLDNELKEGDRALKKQGELIAEYEALLGEQPANDE